MLVSPSYSPDIIDGFIPTLTKYTQKIVDDMGESNGDIIDPMPILEHHVISIILETSMGLRNEISDVERLHLKSCMKNFINSQIKLTTETIFQSCKRSSVVFTNLIRGEKFDKDKFISYAKRIIEFRLEEPRQVRDISDNVA